MTTVKLQLEPLTCPSCIKKIETKVGKMEGVEEARVLFNSSKVKATINEDQVTADDLKDTIEKLGYQVMK
jgi:copper ion binding protein